MSVWETDRTSILTYQACPRKYFYQQKYLGTGIQKKSKGLALYFGSAFHEGAEDLLHGKVEEAVARACKYLDDGLASKSVDLEMLDTQTAYGIAEQKAIVEGLIRGWWAKDGERFLKEFEVLADEQEGRAALTHSHDGVAESEDMVLMFRPDALVRERSSGDFYIVSWKTASTFGERTVNQYRTDMQSMSEAWGVEETSLNLTVPGPEMPLNHVYERMKIEGILYLFAVKGQRKMDDYLGYKTQDTPLAYCWKKAGATSEDDEYAWKYSWPTEEMNAKTGKLVTTKLGKGWRKVPVWTEYPGGVKAWIEALAANQIAPRHINALESIFPQSMPVSRRVDEIESWKRQVVGQEKRIQSAVEIVNSLTDNPEAFRMGLDEQFPQSTRSCFAYNSKCSFFDICFTPAVMDDPMSSGLYKIREANHPELGKGDEDE